ncbi:sarcosine oxidase [Penicillium lagena]|uniref:sarcosine oxidase n=1 Tax=Penicillium lagena TaxID=94218 RepID=UPI00253F68BD|nr:sarcosine oxidase [Penicillium lagena]KAJ5612566.1 sarcosine oxidase [Penicillium lagena]
MKEGDPIIVVGAGIFGLSTALHLARRGYSVTVFDRHPYDESQYSYLQGADAASADINKIIRSAYGGQTEYQSLSIEAITAWHEWNEEIASGKTVPQGMTRKDRVFIANGNISMSTDAELPPWEKACIDEMEKAGHHNTQLATTNPRHCEIATSRGLSSYMDPFQQRRRGQRHVGVLDTTGGMAIADKACRFALHKAREAGAKFVFGPKAGGLQSLRYNGNRVIGIETRDGKLHQAAMTILACGAWTPVLLPELDGLCEATAGSVILIKIPTSSPLWDRLGPEQFPTFTFNMRAGSKGGLYGFPRTENGYFKIGYRGTKYTNPLQHSDGKERSTPATRWSVAERDGTQPVGERLTDFPRQAYQVIQTFLDKYLPELREENISILTTRICWYTDTFDNHFVVDRVPRKQGLMVATGGSGHAFKYLPNIGNWVVDIMENVNTDRKAIQAWRWRDLGSTPPINDLMEGSQGERAWRNIALSKESAMKPTAKAAL